MNIEKLKDAYAIIDGIPEEAFDLALIITEKGESLSCGTIACAAGWLGLHPTFLNGAGVISDHEYHCFNDGKSGEFMGFGTAMATVFDIDVLDAQRLFEPVSSDEKALGLSDKEIWKSRMLKFIKDAERK